MRVDWSKISLNQLDLKQNHGLTILSQKSGFLNRATVLQTLVYYFHFLYILIAFESLSKEKIEKLKTLIIHDDNLSILLRINIS